MWVSLKSFTGVSPQTSPLESAGLDQLDPSFHKLTRDFILELLTSILTFSFQTMRSLSYGNLPMFSFY